MKKWPLYIVLFLVVVQKNNFENLLSSIQIIYKNIHQNWQKNHPSNSIIFHFSQAEFQGKLNDHHELWVEGQWYDIASIHTISSDSIVVSCKQDHWDTYLSDVIKIITDSAPSIPYSHCTKQTKSWNFEVLITWTLEHFIFPKSSITFFTAKSLIPLSPSFKVPTPPPLVG